ncbi:unnamed protein product, partial [Rotaria magnacalcarata]
IAPAASNLVPRNAQPQSTASARTHSTASYQVKIL